MPKEEDEDSFLNIIAKVIMQRRQFLNDEEDSAEQQDHDATAWKL